MPVTSSAHIKEWSSEAPSIVGKWMAEAIDFVNKNQDILASNARRTFLACMSRVFFANREKRTGSERCRTLDPILEAVPKTKPVGIGHIRWKASNYSNLSWLNKKMSEVEKDLQKGISAIRSALIRARAREPLYARFIQRGTQEMRNDAVVPD